MVALNYGEDYRRYLFPELLLCLVESVDEAV